MTGLAGGRGKTCLHCIWLYFCRTTILTRGHDPAISSQEEDKMVTFWTSGTTLRALHAFVENSPSLLLQAFTEERKNKHIPGVCLTTVCYYKQEIFQVSNMTLCSAIPKKDKWRGNFQAICVVGCGEALAFFSIT